MVMATSTVVRLAPDSDTTAIASRDARDRHQPVHHPHHHGIDPSEEAGDKADDESNGDADDCGAKADQQRDASAVENARQHVAAIGVCTEQVFRARLLQPQRGREQLRIVRRKPRPQKSQTQSPTQGRRWRRR